MVNIYRYMLTCMHEISRFKVYIDIGGTRVGTFFSAIVIQHLLSGGHNMTDINLQICELCYLRVFAIGMIH